MREEKISLKTAKLAKEKGFDVPTAWYYHPHYGLNTAFWDEESDGNDNHNSDKWAEEYYSAPEQSLLQKWLREKYEIYVTPTINIENKKCGYELFDFKKQETKEYYDSVDDWDLTYEEALEEGIYEALKLIEL